jgi:hypothetical protein
MKRYILLLFCITPLTVWAISNLKANGQGEWTVTSVPSLLQITADLSRPGAVLSGGVYADINENGILDPVDYSWNWRYGYITDGIGWIKDPANPLAALLGDDGPADGKLNLLFPLLRDQVKLWPEGTAFIFLKDEDGSSAVIRLNLHLQASAPAIVGKLTAAATGAPIAGMALTAMKQSGGLYEFATARTNAEGKYSLLLGSGSWDVYVDGGGEGTGAYLPAQALALSLAEGDILTRNFSLASYPALIKGSVLHEDGTPAKRVLIFAPGANFLIAKTDDSGQYILGTNPGYVQLSISHNMLANYMELAHYYEEPRFQNVNAVAGETQANFILKKYTSFIAGRCTVNGAGVMGVQVVANFSDPATGSSKSSAALSGEDGGYLIGVMPGKIESLSFFMNGLEAVHPAGPITGLTATANDTLEGTDVQFRIAEGPNSISGVVVGPAGQPAAGIYVAAVEEQALFHDSFLIQYTNARGEFTFNGLKEGAWRVGLFRQGASCAPAMAYYDLNNGQHITGLQFILTGFTGIATGSGHSPQDFVLGQNYPNPFNSETAICFTLVRPEKVTLSIHDALGRLVRHIAYEPAQAGLQRLHWDGRDEAGRDLASGLYPYTVQTGARVARGKMLLLR